MSHAIPNRPWERIGIDIFTHHGHDYIISVDYLSRDFEIDRLQPKKSSDVIHRLKQQWARHGIPMQVVSDNSPFGSAEFQDFARRWEFEHVTSSPRYPQSNGKAEAAVKMAKKIMEKAAEAHSDPFLALLEWRNTPTEGALSPAQIMFGRRTRTRLPVHNELLNAPSAGKAKAALTKSKQRQATYYNRNAIERPTLPVGQTVRVRFNDNSDWRKAEIVRSLQHRAYEVKLEDGTTRRRNSSHVKPSAESPVIDRADLLEPSQQVSVQQVQEHQQPPTTGVEQSANSDVVTKTRSGRIIKRPARYRE